MNLRLMLACILGFAAGTVALPLGLSLAGFSQSPAAHMQPAHHTLAPASQTVIGDEDSPTPAQFLGVQDTHCVFLSSTSKEETDSISGPNDPRLRPCAPAVNNYVALWSHRPNTRQRLAWESIEADLRTHHPDASFNEAKTAITVALSNVQ